MIEIKFNEGIAREITAGVRLGNIKTRDGFNHHQYYTNRNLLKRVREVIIEVNNQDIAEEGGAT